jgi:hypothetical protein
MSMLHPTYTLSIESLRSSNDTPVGDLDSIVVDRGIDVRASVLRLHKERSGVAVGSEVTVESTGTATS